MALAYGVVASGLVQIGGTILPIFHAAEWVQQVFVVLIAVGFPFALVLAWAFDLTSSGIQRTANVSGLRVTSRRQVWVLALVGTAVAALALSGYWFWRPWQAQTLRLTSRTAGAKSIAVLPFQNLSAEKENAFFVDGVPDTAYKTLTIPNSNEHAFMYWESRDGQPPVGAEHTHTVRDDVIGFLNDHLK